MIVTGQEKLILEISTPSGNFEYDLSQDNRISVEGILGVTEITVCDGKVWVEDSPCQNKTCVHQGKISSGGRWLCCAPNQVFAIIKDQGSQTDESVKTDALSF